MARLQILELPEGANDDRPPFVLVVDQWPDTVTANEPAVLDAWKKMAEQAGARTVLLTEDTIDIPANDVPVDENGHPLFLKVHVEGEFEKFREQVQDEIRKAPAELRQAVNRDASADASAELIRSENARDQLRNDRDEARSWARHGYEIGQKHCSWTDHGVAPEWLTEGWPSHIDSCEHLQLAAQYDEAISRVRALALGNQTQGEGGGLVDADTLWPSQVLAAIGPLGSDTERSPEE
ncbi:hypothetical protein [Streptomyces sp. NPDC020747]|uniref:hypothetical protein n=1 Tax=Streptomyces sp. NPDC020747 TaxID=3365086 RepID=UPI0037AC77CB